MIFINLTKIKVRNPPDIGLSLESEANCQFICLNTCSVSRCNAYSYKATYSDHSIFLCWIWTRQLPTLQENQDDGRDLSILVKRSDIDNSYFFNSYIILLKDEQFYSRYLCRINCKILRTLWHVYNSLSSKHWAKLWRSYVQ
jgi:hypothetical protein